MSKKWVAPSTSQFGLNSSKTKKLMKTCRRTSCSAMRSKCQFRRAQIMMRQCSISLMIRQFSMKRGGAICSIPRRNRALEVMSQSNTHHWFTNMMFIFSVATSYHSKMHQLSTYQRRMTSQITEQISTFIQLAPSSRPSVIRLDATPPASSQTTR